MHRHIVALSAGLALLPVAAVAQTQGTVTTDLNLRQGPSTSTEVVTTIPNGSAVTINGCVASGDWCEVAYNGAVGFGSAQYLATTVDGATVVVADQPSVIGSVIEGTGQAVGGVVEGTGQAVGGVAEGAGRAVGGVAAGVGSVAGGVVGAVGDAVGGVVDAITPTRTTNVYVEQNPLDSAYLDREVAVGTDVPTDVPLALVPESEYQYTYINDRPVLVEPSSRRVVYVYR